MQKQLNQAHSQANQELTILLKGDLVMGEFPDKVQVIKFLANLLQRLSKLYQLPNWDEENSVILSEWIYDNYKYDSLRDIINCLKSPPQIRDEDGNIETSWRLTPDTVRKWVAISLEKRSIMRENEHNKLKSSREDAQIDYESFRKRMQAQVSKSTWVSDVDFEEFKERMDKLMKINKE